MTHLVSIIRQRCITVLFLLLILLVAPVQTLAQWPGDPMINVPVSLAAGEKNDVYMVTDGQNGALIVWEDKRSGENDIYMQRIDVDGTILWSPDGVPVCTASGYQSLYHSSTSTTGFTPIVEDGSGGAFVVWQDERFFGTRQRDIYCQRIDAGGNPLWTTDGVLVAGGNGNEDLPTLCHDGVGGVIILWQDKNDDPIFNNLYGQRLDGAGNALWNDGTALPLIVLEWSQGSPTVCPDGAGGAFFAWIDNQADVGDVFAQRIDADGNSLWGADGVPVATVANGQDAVVIIASGDGSPVLAWVDRRGGGPDIYAQKLDALTGAPLWSGGGHPICTAGDSQYQPAICPAGAGGAIITWFDHRVATGPPWDLNIFAQRVDADGSYAWMVDGAAVCDAPDAQRYPRVISDGAGGGLFVWEDNRNGTGREDVYAQHLDADGIAQFAANGQGVSLANGNQNRPNLVAGAGGFIAAWTDDRAVLYSADVYADRVLVTVTSSVEQDQINSMSGLVSFSVGPNPSTSLNQITRVNFELAKAANVDFRVFDVSGCLVRLMLPERQIGAGLHTFVWDGRDHRGRVVAGGAYWLTLTIGEGSVTRRLVRLP